MKHLFLSIAMLCALSTFSQETTEKNIKKNEIKINLLYFILDFPEITYERLLTDQTALGVSVAFPIESGASMLGNDLNFIMNPYYRVYFGEKPNTGFFVDGNAALFSQRKTEDDFFTGEKERGMAFGFGFNVGTKYKTKNGWVAETYFGLTKTVINSEYVKRTNILLGIGIIIGKTF
ncbi:MAG: DUF3575 domain-containing protein [Polaribacter sp.]|nr:DUF3575 domain-containing protein [Polaribacter sp.]